MPSPAASAATALDTIPEACFRSTRYATSVAQLPALNAAGLAMVGEVAFVGRSNAGKSSVINVLVGQNRLAFASKMPGRTQMLNFFMLPAPGRPNEEAVPLGYLVDLPGYGFAKTDQATRASWDQLVGGYLQSRRLLAGVVLVMDSRRPLEPADEELLGWLAARADQEQFRVHLLLNKADQLKTSARIAALRSTEERAERLTLPASVQLFSALKQDGTDELRRFVSEALLGAPV